MEVNRVERNTVSGFTPLPIFWSPEMSSTTEETQCSTPVWVGRQPILDRRKRLVAYEVLFRSAESGPARFDDGNQATSAVLMNTFVELGFDQVVDNHIAFMNFTREFLIGEHPLPQCPERLVLEVLEDIVPDQELLTGLKQLRKEGYKIALDDVIYHPSLEPLLELATIVKVELPQIPLAELPTHVESLRKWPVTLLAEKVETLEEFEICRDLGFDLFQGYFFSKPEILQGRKLDSNQVALMKILTEINDPQSDIKKLIFAVEQDPALCIKLLRYVNASHMSIRQTVESLQHACVLLGTERIRTIATLLVLAGNKDLPQQAARTALLRAWMCRGLANRQQAENVHTFFTTGLLSMIDVLMGQPLDILLANLPVDESVCQAILKREGQMGQILEMVIQYERCEWDRFTQNEALSTILRNTYVDSINQVQLAWQA